MGMTKSNKQTNKHNNKILLVTRQQKTSSNNEPGSITWPAVTHKKIKPEQPVNNGSNSNKVIPEKRQKERLECVSHLNKEQYHYVKQEMAPFNEVDLINGGYKPG